MKTAFIVLLTVAADCCKYRGDADEDRRTKTKYPCNFRLVGPRTLTESVVPADISQK